MVTIDRVIPKEKNRPHVTKEKTYIKVTWYEIDLAIDKRYRVYWQDIDNDENVV